jgi:hypothetical protein
MFQGQFQGQQCVSNTDFRLYVREVIFRNVKNVLFKITFFLFQDVIRKGMSQHSHVLPLERSLMGSYKILQ